MPAPVWETYANELKSLGYGYPLWYPEPSKNGEVQIGDVGYIEDGQFQRWFNVMADADDKCNPHGVPGGFQPLHIPDRLFQERALGLPSISSRSVTKEEFHMDIAAYVLALGEMC